MAHITQFPNEVKDLILKHIFRNLTMVLRHDIKRNLDFGVPTLISIRRNLFTRQTVTEAILQHSIIKIEDDAAFEHLSATISPTQRMRVRRILTDVPITSNSTFSTFANVFPNVELLTCTQCYGTDASFETPSRSAAYLPNGLIDLASEYDSEGNTRTRRCRRESVALFDPLRCALEVDIDTKTLDLSSIVHTELLKITDRFPAVWKKQILRATAEHTRLEMNFDLRLCDNQWSQREIICSVRSLSFYREKALTLISAGLVPRTIC